jgi:F-type H+-transporting ATPase subunit b
MSALTTIAAAATVLTAADAGGEETGTGEDAGIFSGIEYPVIPHLGELIAGTICFAVLLFLAHRYAVPRLEAMLAERRSQIQGGIERAAQAQAEADAARDDYLQQLSTARAESARLREEARAEGAAILAEMRAQAQAEAARITEAAQRQVTAERQQAMTQLRSEVGGLATTLAERIVGESLSDDRRQARVIDRFLAELEQADPDDVRAAVTVGAPARDGDDEGGPVRHAVDVAKRLLGGLTHGDDDAATSEPAPADPPAAPSTAPSTGATRVTGGRSGGGSTRGGAGPTRGGAGSTRGGAGSTRAPRTPRQPGGGQPGGGEPGGGKA